MPDSNNPYATEIIRLVRQYETTYTYSPRYLDAARALMLAMAIDRGLTAADVQAIAAAISQATSA